MFKLSGNFKNPSLLKNTLYRNRGFSYSFSNRFASTLLFVEQSKGNISSGLGNAINAAFKIDANNKDNITAIVAGSGAKSAAETIRKYPGIKSVLVTEDSKYDNGFPEYLAPLLKANIDKYDFTHILAASSAYTKNILPRLAALLDVQPLSDVLDIYNENTFKRPIYAGNILTDLVSNQNKQVFTVRSSAFPDIKIDANTNPNSNVQVLDAQSPDLSSAPVVEFVSEELVKSERPDLSSASKIVSGGRALKDKANFDKLIFPLADSIGAAVGASRAAVDSGFCDNSLQVGQTGKVVAPDLYIAVGISGAIQHLAGMKDSKLIVAINKDDECPMFQLADLSLKGDIFTLVPELTEKLNALK